MGIFDLFGRDPKVKDDQKSRFQDTTHEKVQNGPGPIDVFSPLSYNDVEKIIDALKAGKNAVVHLDKLKTETMIRVLDMLSGAVYALGGGLYEMQKNIYMFSPSGVEIK